jgi:hypothetical protein
MVWRVPSISIAMTMLVGLGGSAWPDELLPEPGVENREPKTLGGLQFWTDERICGPYRIQRHVSIGHYRLLDRSETRQAWGSYEACEAALQECYPAETRPPPTKRVVLLLHGLGRGRQSMDALATYLRQEGSDDVVTFGYASTREGIGQHARSLDLVVRRLEGVHEVDLVAYSLGCLVARYWLGDRDQAEPPGALTAPLPKIRRCVMLGPPNHGAERANVWMRSAMGQTLFDLMLGQSGRQLGPEFHDIQDHLATPACQFGIIAGGCGTPEGWNVEIPGDDDGTVGVRETMLTGAADFVVIPVRHNDLIDDDLSLHLTVTFLRHGYFESEAARVSIPSPAQSSPQYQFQPPVSRLPHCR